MGDENLLKKILEHLQRTADRTDRNVYACLAYLEPPANPHFPIRSIEMLERAFNDWDNQEEKAKMIRELTSIIQRDNWLQNVIDEDFIRDHFNLNGSGGLRNIKEVSFLKYCTDHKGLDGMINQFRRIRERVNRRRTRRQQRNEAARERRPPVPPPVEEEDAEYVEYAEE
ncbi:uncharacterized protein LOC129786526 [Lutzomyia longipalpis]|uniref:uncharacterized protein LOC129786526 n=1 Tax=Lutzomyia longipalpis TaxID=7200 RepID=UPI00248445B4|nr:uncharacterized protein LOC129786526 [Lutzomyia longipalpis]